MADSYSETEIEKGKPSYSGHVVYKKAKLKKNKIHIIYKLNKHNNPILSQYEVALSNLLELFLPPSLTPKQTLVKDKKGKIIGLASDHFCYTAFSREPSGSQFCKLRYRKDSKEKLQKEILFNLQKPKEAPIYFLNDFPPGFFADLLNAYQASQFDIDMEALASIFCSSYTLEEDDLHKGNIGFYVVMREKEGVKIPTVVFFKIDNDLLMSNSLMSHFDARIPNWHYGANAFAITARDLITFLRTKDSGNHYWPGKFRYCVNPCDSKVYNDLKERKAFIQLGKLKEFKEAKWKEFYKYILLQTTMIEASLSHAIEINDPNERAQLDLITQATVARLSQLKAVLFSIPEFREVVASTDNKLLLDRIFCRKDRFRSEYYDILKKQMDLYKNHCQASSNFFDSRDTPLHVAIRLGDFRYQETWMHFKEFANQSNSKGETPLDLALQLVQANSGSKPDVRSDPCFVAKFLLKQGALQTDNYKQFCQAHPHLNLKSYRFPTIYLNEAAAATNLENLKTLLFKLSKDSSFCLKMKKELSIACMKAYIKNNKNRPNFGLTLTAFQQALTKGDPELQFIRQLRSSLWIVRLIRGLFGRTSTEVALNDLIDRAKSEILTIPSVSKLPGFFSHEPCHSRESASRESLTRDHHLDHDVHAA